MKRLLLIVLTMGVLGCRNEEQHTQQIMVVKPVTCNTHRTISFNDPALYGGASILNCFYADLRIQDYAAAINMTAPVSIKKFGKERILKYYQGIEYDYRPVLLSIRRYTEDSAKLRYEVMRYATLRYVDITTIVVDDTARVELPEQLQNFLR